MARGWGNEIEGKGGLHFGNPLVVAVIRVYVAFYTE